LDVGSNSVKLQVVDAAAGRAPLPVQAFKDQGRLSERGTSGGEIGHQAMNRLVSAISRAKDVADQQDVDELFAFATEAIRAAPNRELVCRRIASATGVDLHVCSGEEEARFGFLAARRWFGWSAGRLLYLELGGGSLQIAFGHGEEPDFAASVPLGVGELSRRFLRHKELDTTGVTQLGDYVRDGLDEIEERLRWEGSPASAVASGRTFKRLAGVAGAAADAGEGVGAGRAIGRQALKKWLRRTIAAGDLNGDTDPARSRHRFAGAVVADELMGALDIDRLHLCPWAVREGLMLRRGDDWSTRTAARDQRVVEDAKQTVGTSGREAGGKRQRGRRTSTA